MLRYKIERSWFSHLVRHLARKWSGSILTTLEPAWGEHGLASFIGAKDDGSGGDNWTIRHAKLQSNVTTNKPTPNFYRPDALPVTQPTVSKH